MLGRLIELLPFKIQLKACLSLVALTCSGVTIIRFRVLLNIRKVN